MEIIIIRYKNKAVEERCIASVKKFTDLRKHKLTIYDNAKHNINLGKLWNDLIEKSDKEEICLLNSDTIVEENWTSMVGMLSLDKIGAIGPITDHCGTIQKSLKRENRIREVASNQLSGFCYILNKTAWKNVGKFPEDMPFYGQESVFNVKLSEAGYKLLIDQSVFVHHDGGATHKKYGKKDDKYWGAFHYHNFVWRCSRVRKKVVIIGAPESKQPTFQGLNQFVADFRGVHLGIDATYLEIMLHNPDLVIVVQTRLQPALCKTLKTLKGNGIPTALYFMDLRSPNDAMYKSELPKNLNEYFTKAFICVKAFVQDWEETYELPVQWLPQATIQQPRPGKPNHYKLVHVGGLDSLWHEGRRELVNYLGATQFNETQKEARQLIIDQMWSLYGGSKFSLAMSPDYYGYTSDRIYHIMGSGGCLLSYDPGGLEHLSEFGLWFTTKKEAKELMDTPKEICDKIRVDAFEEIQSKHLYKDRIIEIIEAT